MNNISNKDREEAIDKVRKILEKPMLEYKKLLVREFDNEIDESYIYDTMVEIFADNFTRSDAVALMELITPEFCKICGAEPMTANCNNANCQYTVADYV
jgi:phosphoribosylformylglycinamidine (FGAM) synthase-like enzyme